MMSAPPMVGVPRLVWCEVGPSSRMNWPYPLRTRNLMNNGVPSNDTTSEIMPASSTAFMKRPPTRRPQADGRRAIAAPHHGWT